MNIHSYAFMDTTRNGENEEQKKLFTKNNLFNVMCMYIEHSVTFINVGKTERDKSMNSVRMEQLQLFTFMKCKLHQFKFLFF